MTIPADRAVSRSANPLDLRAASGRPLLACYFPMGDPLFDDVFRDIYVDAGVDIIELGLPTADPFLDGPDVAGAMARALAGPLDSYERLARMAQWLAADETRPAGACMAYDLDLSRIAPETLDAIDGLLLIGRSRRNDAGALDRAMRDHGVRECGLVPLGFTQGDAQAALALDGYVMMQASPGVTGPRRSLDEGLASAMAELRRAGVERPILAGFGIGTAVQAREAVDKGADGVVIGSMCMRKALEGPDALHAFLCEVRSTLDA